MNKLEKNPQKKFYIKKFYENSNKIETYIFLLIVVFCTCFSIIFNSLDVWIAWVSSFFGILASKTASEGKWTTFVFDILSYIVYIFSCIKQQYYGEMILSYIVIFCHMIGIIQWKNNQNDNIVKVNKIKKKEFFVFVSISIFIFSIYYFLLRSFHSNLALINAMASILFLMGNYCSYRRSVCQFVFWGIYEICFLITWFRTISYSSLGGLIFLIDGICELGYNIVGIKKWSMLKNSTKEIIKIQCHKTKKVYCFKI